MTQAEEIAALRRELADMRDRLARLEAVAPPPVYHSPTNTGPFAPNIVQLEHQFRAAESSSTGFVPSKILWI